MIGNIRYYNEMKDGTRKVQIWDSLFRCPFCYRDQNRDYQYGNLLQHASRISRSSHTKDVRERAGHLALEKYMSRYLNPRERPAEAKSVLEDDFGQSGGEAMTYPLKRLEKPSEIQKIGIVPFCQGNYVIQQAQSGTGKTATFCCGILQRLDYNLIQCQALVLAPARELAQQIEKVMSSLGDYLGAKVHACVGGTSVRED